MRNKFGQIMLFIVVSICLIASQASGQDAGIYSNRSDIVRGGDNPVLQISNVLGVKTEVDAYSLYVNNDLLNYLTQMNRIIAPTHYY